MSTNARAPQRDKAALMLTSLVGVISACVVAAASAQEKAIELASAPGREIVEKSCNSCHSLDYIPMNSPILDDRGWTAEVNKMIDVFGAPIKPTETRIIIDYLVKNYGAGAGVR
jgi:sulfite dehydrogenase (cytochrome) subunit B